MMAEPPADDSLGIQPGYSAEDEQREIAKKPLFEDYLVALTPQQCEEREVWIYRERGKGLKKERLEVCSLPVNQDGYERLQDYVREEWGGGQYDVHLKIKGPGGHRPNDHHGGFFLGGPPKWRNTAGPELVTPPAASVPAAVVAGETTLALELVKQLRDNKPENPMQQVGETIKIMKDLREELSPKAEAPDPIRQFADMARAVKDVYAAIAPPAAPVAPPAPPVDVAAQLKSALEMATQLRSIVTPPAAPAAPAQSEGLGLLGGIKVSEIAELVKAGQGDLVRTVLMGAADKPGFLDVLINAGIKLGDRPDVLSKVGDAFAGLINVISARLAPTQPGAPSEPIRQPVASPQTAIIPAPTHARVPTVQEFLASRQAEAQAPADSPAPPSGSEALPNGDAAVGHGGEPEDATADLEAMLGYLLPMLADAVAYGKSGGRTAEHIGELFPDTVEPLTDMFQQAPDDAVLALLRTRPEIAPVMGAPRFPEFFSSFKARILQGFDEDEESEEEAGVEIQATAESSPVQ